MSDAESHPNSNLVPAAQSQPDRPIAETVKEQAPDILDAIPSEKPEPPASFKYERHEISMRSAPLPDPKELAAYNQIIPNGAERILKMAENQSAHRIEIEKIAVKSQQRQGFCGQLFGLIIGLSGLGLATYAAVEGQPWFGGTISSGTLGSLVAAFLVSRNNQKRELEEKKPQVEPEQPQFPLKRKKKRDRNR
jgi:uncharacterized membrane protein